MARARPTELNSTFAILEILEMEGAGVTVNDLCGRLGLSRRSGFRHLHELSLAGLIWRKRGGFGKPVLITLAEKGYQAVRCTRRLQYLLSPDSSPLQELVIRKHRGVELVGCRA